MKFIKHFLVVACIASAQISCASQDAIDTNIILTAQETQLIQTNRILKSFKNIIESIEASHNWSIFENATNPNRTETLVAAAPELIGFLENVFAKYATCFGLSSSALFGLVTVDELYIVDNKTAGLELVQNKEFMELLDKAIKLFEEEYEGSKYFDSLITVTINPIESASVTIDLHQIRDMIKSSKKNKNLIKGMIL